MSMDKTPVLGSDDDELFTPSFSYDRIKAILQKQAELSSCCEPSTPH